MSASHRVYLAGPLFSQAERRWNRELARLLEQAGCRVNLPQDTASEPLQRDPPDFEGCFRLCREGVAGCDVVVAILDGADADSGTCWECAYAYARGIPVVAVRTDLRAGEEAGMNLMLSRSAAAVVQAPPGEERVEWVAERVLEALRRVSSAQGA
ncbi:MAG: nucleoside 2-deoxyribosyltransferase [Myxococcota bacterium]